MNYRDIQGWCDFESIYNRIIENAGNGFIFVEVGVWLGRSIAVAALAAKHSKKDIKIYAVDTWNGSDEQVHQNYINRIGGSDALYSEFMSNMKAVGVDDIIIPVRCDSIKAAEKFEDNSIDFCFIDASHEYLDVLADVKAWLPKIKQGGVIAGHDYPWPPVKQAVNELFPNHRVDGSSWLHTKE